jgi:hypothetical protein
MCEETQMERFENLGAMVWSFGEWLNTQYLDGQYCGLVPFRHL